MPAILGPPDVRVCQGSLALEEVTYGGLLVSHVVAMAAW